MNEPYDIENLIANYDKGRLVPFIGSGMSRPACRDWSQLVFELERWCGIDRSAYVDQNLILRSQNIIQTLRQSGDSSSIALEECLYEKIADNTTAQSNALASIHWPLLCTTNYDDIYINSKFKISYKKRLKFKKSKKTSNSIILPKVKGRSEIDCYRVTQQLNFPDGEMIWALQGFLRPRSNIIRDKLGNFSDFAALEHEIVLGHADYRKVSHRASHFRRCFGEVYRRSSFLFLGSGLSEPYFRSIFDEIIELVGPPTQPHFALVEEGSVDTDFLEHQYHILCKVYPKGQHADVANVLDEMALSISSPRSRLTKWGFRMTACQIASENDADEHFCVVRALLPQPDLLALNEVIALSCGRRNTEDGIGAPLIGSYGFNLIKGRMDYVWCSEAHWNVKWTYFDNVFGIVARDQISLGEMVESSGERRNPRAIQKAFYDFLTHMASLDIKLIHVQLLAADASRVWAPWVSIVQMARAYGQWFKTKSLNSEGSFPRVMVYVVDPSVIALLQGGSLDLRSALDCSKFNIKIEIVDARGEISVIHRYVSPEDNLSDVLLRYPMHLKPELSAYPQPRISKKTMAINQTISEFGLVAGSTLIIDFRKRNI